MSPRQKTIVCYSELPAQPKVPGGKPRVADYTCNASIQDRKSSASLSYLRSEQPGLHKTLSPKKKYRLRHLTICSVLSSLEVQRGG